MVVESGSRRRDSQERGNSGSDEMVILKVGGVVREWCKYFVSS